MNKWTIAIGNAFEGIELYGVFDTHDEAVEWGEKSEKTENREWWSVEITVEETE